MSRFFSHASVPVLVVLSLGKSRRARKEIPIRGRVPLLPEDAERKYFSFLGESALQGRDAAFWDFHRERLASINYSLNRAFMAKWICLVVLDHIGNPKRTLEYLWPRRGRIFSAGFRFIRTVYRNFVRKATTPFKKLW